MYLCTDMYVHTCRGKKKTFHKSLCFSFNFFSFPYIRFFFLIKRSFSFVCLLKKALYNKLKDEIERIDIGLNYDKNDDLTKCKEEKKTYIIMEYTY